MKKVFFLGLLLSATLSALAQTVTVGSHKISRITFSGDQVNVTYCDGTAAASYDMASLLIRVPETVGETGAATLKSEYDYVRIAYTPQSGWNTLCQPFELTATQMDALVGSGWKAYRFSGYGADGALKFETTTTIEAGVPYLVYVAEARTGEAPVLEDMKMGARTPQQVAQTDASQQSALFVGTYQPMTGSELSERQAFGVTPDGEIRLAGTQSSLQGLRAYFVLPEGRQSALLSVDGDMVTAINTIQRETRSGNDDCYDLQGRRVQRPTKGLYIVNGKKRVVTR